MDLKALWLSPKGRASRKDFWLRTYFPLFVVYLAAIAIDIVFGLYSETNGFGLVSGIVYLLMIWPFLSVVIKRCHDRNRSGWFILLMIVPLLNIWPVVELYFLRGTIGENKYGEDPVEDPTLQSDPIKNCPECGAKYRLGDYQPDVEKIFCSTCKTELSRA